MKKTWEIENHLCRKCGGRILRCVSGAGMTPGGNSVFRCADCGFSASGVGPEVVCWCGFSHRHNRSLPYLCLPFSVITEHPEIKSLFLACGCDPDRGGEVGIVLLKDLRAYEATQSNR